MAACIVEAGVSIGLSAILIHLLILDLRSWDGSFMGGGPPEPVTIPTLDIVVLVLLPVLALLAGAVPAALKASSKADTVVAIGVSFFVCSSVAIVFFFVFQVLIWLTPIILLPVFILIPILVDRWI